MRIDKILFFIFCTSCITTSERSLTSTGVFQAPYSLVWQSALLTLKNYPIQTTDQEAGEIITKAIRGYQVWTPPPKMIKNPRNRHYTLKILLSRGIVQGDSAIKVQIIKEEFINKDFIQQSIPVQSNGLEEEIILYRIGRTVHLAKLKNKIMSSENEEELEEQL